MIRNSVDVANRVSPKLSALMDSRASDPDLDHAMTLAEIREYVTDRLPNEFDETEHMHQFDVSESVIDELDALIEEYGDSALVTDFIQSAASEPLSRVIEAVMNDENRDGPATLGMVQEAVASGLASRLIGEGTLEEDEDDTLSEEIQGLIDRYGSDAMAEDFLRYE